MMTATRSVRSGAVRWAVHAVTVLVALLALYGCGNERASFKNTDLTGASYARDFKLTDAAGAPHTLADFRGKVVTVFFGYTHCPNVCPTTLAEMSEIKRALGADGAKLQVIFVTVDPERDTPEILGNYARAFDASFIALTGSTEQIAAVAKEFKVFYEKVPGKDPHNYSMNHTAGSYVFDLQGRLRLFLRHGQGTDTIVSDLHQLIDGR